MVELNGPVGVESPAHVAEALSLHGYLPDDGLATAVFLALSLKRPLLLEGEAGVGKTEVAKVLSRWTGGELIRLQCYEGIDAAQAVYDWDYSRQLLHLRAAEASGEARGLGTGALEEQLYQEQFLLKRALLRAIDHHHETPPILLIDEIDRADDEFEAYLLEVLSDYQVTVPELGLFTAKDPPVVILTSNRTRDVHDALKRRCLYHWVEHPTFEREVDIVRLRVPHVLEPLAAQVAAAVEAMRGQNLYKPPGVAETIDWATALAALGVSELDEATVDATLGAVLKYREDQEKVRQQNGLADVVKRAYERSQPARAEELQLERTAIVFARVLRRLGLNVPVGHVLDFASALAVLGVDRHDDVYWAARCTLLRRPEDLPTFDRAFAVFWDHARVDDVEIIEEVVRIALATDDEGDEETSDDTAEPSSDPTIQLRFSTTEVLRDKDFSAYDDTELLLAQALMGQLRFAGPPRQSFRQSPSRRGPRPDVRATMRASLRTSGEPVRRQWREPGERLRRLVLLLDISGSMEPYARAMLRFVHAAVAGRQRVEAFALGTRLTRLTRELSSRDPDRALRQASARVQDWSGGTRLGECLLRFNDEWGVRGMARNSIVVILSDGWDRGDPATLAEQMRRLHRITYRTIWVNPLKVTPGYAPLARGMAAALPYVDEFVEGHSVAAMEQLAAVISDGSGTSDRSGRPRADSRIEERSSDPRVAG